jgi:CBS domain-containing protein
MTPDPVTICPETTLPEADHLMKKCNVRRLPVVEQGRLVGIVTLGDIRDASPSCTTALSFYEWHYLLARLTVRDVMTRDPIWVSPETSLQAAGRLMLEHNISGLPVCDEAGRLVGIITDRDIFRVLLTEAETRPLLV